jgi:hypothetical protein
MVKTIALGKRIDYHRSMSGGVHNSLEGWSSRSRISGTTNAEWNIAESSSKEGAG